MNDWIIGNRVPRIKGKVFQVQTVGDHVRTVEFRPDRDYCTLWFTDCTHPAQNAICSDYQIKAWRENVSALPSRKSKKENPCP